MSIKTTAALVLSLLVSSLAQTHAQTQAQAQTPAISVEGAFSRATPNGAKVGAGYMTIVNKGSSADRLVSVSSPAAAKVEVHEMSMDHGVMKMRELPDGLPIDAAKSVTLSPGGFHLMMTGLKAPLKEGDKVPLSLTFEKAGKIDVTLDVRGIGAQAPAGMTMPSHGDPMHKM